MTERLWIPPMVIITACSLGSWLTCNRSQAVPKRTQAVSTRVVQCSDQKNIRGKTMSDKITKTDEQWRDQLTPEQYRIARQKGTEPAFAGKYHHFEGKGIFRCVCCGNNLFSSETKFDSGSGWPSFWAPISKQNIQTSADKTMGVTRIEVMCNRCGAHLGHLFEDGPAPSGLRYCINSAVLDLVEEKQQQD